MRPFLRGTAAGYLRDPLLLGLILLSVVASVGLLSGAGSHSWRVILLWASQPPLDLLLGRITGRIAKAPGTPKAPRRFFRAFSFAGYSFAVGDSVQTVLAIRDPVGAENAGAIQSALFVVGMLVLVCAMLTYPAAVDSARQRLRFWLDAGTVLVGAGALAWTMTIRPSASLGTTALAAGLMMVAAFAAVKLLLSGQAPMTRAGTIACIAAAVLQGATIYVVARTGAQANGLVLLLRWLPSVLVAVGPRIQELELRADPRWAGRRRTRSYSLLPYGMVVLALVALGFALPGTTEVRVWGLLVALAVIIALVILRQLDSFIDNEQLIVRLDASLDELGRHEQRFRSMLAHSSDLIMLVAADGRITYVSPAVERILGIAPAAALGALVSDLLHPDDVADTVRQFRELMGRPHATVVTEARVRHADGSWRRIETASTNLLDDPGVAGVVCNARDVTENRDFQDRLRYEATHDGLTRLPNRTLFAERLEAAALGRAAMLSIDLDDFKIINDTLGHAAGDAVLCAVADRLRECVRREDTPARLGGDEFAVLLPGASSVDARWVADRLRVALMEPVAVDGEWIPVRASVGIAETLGESGDVLLRRADSAMYVAKQKGKGPRARVPS